MSDVSGSGVKLISVTIVTPISFEGVVGFFGGCGQGRGSMEMGKEVWARGSGGGGEGFLLADGVGIKPG